MESVKDRQNQWLLPVILGAIFVIIGIMMVVLKRDSLNIILIVSGVLLLIYGVINAYNGYKEQYTIGIVVGVVAGVIGVLLIVIPQFFNDIMMILLAVFLIISGLVCAISNLSAPAEKKAAKIIPIVVGVVMVALGVYALFNLNTAEDIVMIVIGILTAISGVIQIIDGFALKKELA